MDTEPGDPDQSPMSRRDSCRAGEGCALMLDALASSLTTRPERLRLALWWTDLVQRMLQSLAAVAAQTGAGIAASSEPPAAAELAAQLAQLAQTIRRAADQAHTIGYPDVDPPEPMSEHLRWTQWQDETGYLSAILDAAVAADESAGGDSHARP